MRRYSQFWLAGGQLTEQWPPDDTDPADLPPPSAAELAAYASLPAVVHRAVERLAYGQPLSGLTSFDAAYERRRKDKPKPMTQRPTRAEVEQAHQSLPAFPPGLPTDQWSSEQLAAYADYHQHQLTNEQAALIPWDSFSQRQLAALSECKTEAQAQAMLAAFARGEEPPAPEQRQQRHKPVKVTR
jgi:hypothetical protein